MLVTNSDRQEAFRYKYINPMQFEERNLMILRKRLGAFTVYAAPVAECAFGFDVSKGTVNRAVYMQLYHLFSEYRDGNVELIEMALGDNWRALVKRFFMSCKSSAYMRMFKHFFDVIKD